MDNSNVIEEAGDELRARISEPFLLAGYGSLIEKCYFADFVTVMVDENLEPTTLNARWIVFTTERGAAELGCDTILDRLPSDFSQALQ